MKVYHHQVLGVNPSPYKGMDLLLETRICDDDLVDGVRWPKKCYSLGWKRQAVSAFSLPDCWLQWNWTAPL